MSCDTAGGLLIYYYINFGIGIIMIIAPILLLVLGTIDFMGVVTSGDEKGMRKSIQTFLKRMLICILILLLPTIMSFIMSFAADITGVESNLFNCLDKATKENIKLKEEEEKASRESLIKKIQEKIQKQKEEDEKRLEEERKKIEEEGTIKIAQGASKNIDNALGVVYYNQCDGRWTNIRYDVGGGFPQHNNNATLCSSACGYTSFAMIAAGLNNDLTINPYSVVKHMRNIKDGELTSRGYGAASFGGELTNPTKLAKYNLKAEKISYRQINDALNEGKPVLIGVNFYNKPIGHYMVLSKASNGNIVLLDPSNGLGRGSGEYTSIESITQAYGCSIDEAAAYSKI